MGITCGKVIQRLGQVVATRETPDRVTLPRVYGLSPKAFSPEQSSCSLSCLPIRLIIIINIIYLPFFPTSRKKAEG
jgi:hypothetical protein